MVLCEEVSSITKKKQKCDTCYRPTVVNAECNIGSKKNPNAGVKFNYAIDKYSQAYGEVVCCFRHLVEDNIYISKPNVTQKDFFTSNKDPEHNPG